LGQETRSVQLTESELTFSLIMTPKIGGFRSATT
jgi:hypothetical protein